MSNTNKVTIAIVDDELTGLRHYVERHGWQIEWYPERLHLVFLGNHPKDNAPVKILADVNHYRELPPAWSFEKTSNDGRDKPFPISSRGPNRKSSVFHGSHCICAHFNRLAYSENNGPHSDWGGARNWLQIDRAGQVYATKIAEMFAIILGHLFASGGMRK